MACVGVESCMCSYREGGFLFTCPDTLAMHNAQRHRQTVGRTDDSIMPIADHTARQHDRLNGCA